MLGGMAKQHHRLRVVPRTKPAPLRVGSVRLADGITDADQRAAHVRLYKVLARLVGANSGEPPFASDSVKRKVDGGQ
jgi:hypothetical protein